ncbi:MAG: hypothetical protein E7361_01185 [Clostridiales bacterium]|nr:hypothetical protein [Clostridiales bacterium]
MAKLDYKNIEIEKDKFFGVYDVTEKDEASSDYIFGHIFLEHTVSMIKAEDILSEDLVSKLDNNGNEFDFDNVNLPEKSINDDQEYVSGFLRQSSFFNEFYESEIEKIGKEDDKNKYFLAVEEDEEDCHIVRGVVKLDNNGNMAIALNPEHEKRIDHYNDTGIVDKMKIYIGKSDDPYALRDAQDRINEKIKVKENCIEM